MRCCIDAGGTVTGEHGIGNEKRGMRYMYSPADLEIMERPDRPRPAGSVQPWKIFGRRLQRHGEHPDDLGRSGAER
jgi:glycolate oxidase